MGFHVSAITLLSIPMPHVSDKDLRDPSVQEWFDGAYRTVTSLGFTVEHDAFVEDTVALARTWLDVRNTLAKPARFYADWTGARQSWAMFGGIPDNAAELVIEVHEDGGWREVHVTRQHDKNWLRPVLDQERWRSFLHQFVRKKNRGAWRRFVNFVADRAAEDFPEADKVRLGWRRVELVDAATLAELGALPRGKRHWDEVRDLDKVREEGR